MRCLVAIGLAFVSSILVVSCSDRNADLEEEYSFLAKASSPRDELCKLSSQLKDSYRKDRNSTKFKFWSERQEVDCAKGKGIVSGELSYPSDGIPPDLKVCWRNLETEESECVTPSGDRTYEISLAEGEYHIWARTDSDTSYRGFYSAASKCGLSVDCLSHKPLNVPVIADQTTSNIDPSDWYGPEGASYD